MVCVVLLIIKAGGIFSVDHDHDCQHERWPRRSKVVAWGVTLQVVPLSFLGVPRLYTGVVVQRLQPEHVAELGEGREAWSGFLHFALVGTWRGRPCKKDPGDGTGAVRYDCNVCRWSVKDIKDNPAVRKEVQRSTGRSSPRP